MYHFTLCEQGKTIEFLIEESAFSGVHKIANTVAEDIYLITNQKPEIINDLSKIKSRGVVIFGTIGKSNILNRLTKEDKLCLDPMYRNKENNTASKTELKREVYTMQIVTMPFEEYPEIEQALVIAGSDKRGTIYGMFHLSELCGVSPLVYWGDVVPKQQEMLTLSISSRFFSKEPSVRYRGFFINDEWPAFGNWSTETFGDVNAAAYQKVFELLLRLKGNYLWPAMWNSSFSEDGPGIENARLADEYGVIMGTSHHEPLCRAGVEWQRVYKKYGNSSEWNFHSNGKAISKFWEDGLKRNLPYENVITIGMRGECDSKLMSEHATRKDNIELLKDVIKAQHQLIKEQTDKELSEVPRMLAIYKEVEDYYYGDDTCEGLRDWKELEDVIFLLSDDNFGNLRTLPEENDRKHAGGFGMYYHFDYHGAPISYEWQNSIKLSKIWEQMTMAYDYGVQTMWIVNVGDIKSVEYPLCYFMELAYDFEQWGSQTVESAEKFAAQWINQQFGDNTTEKQRQDMLHVLNGFLKFNSNRRPEAMNETIYHPVHFNEGQRLHKEAELLEKEAEQLRKELSVDCLAAYDSMIYYSAAASLNMLLMNLEAGMNQYLAKRGSTYANYYKKLAEHRICRDRELIQQFHSLKQGKWNHMMKSAHTGFRSWNDYDWRYPVLQEIIPIPAAKAIISFSGSDTYTLGRQWQDERAISNDEFLYPDTQNISIEIDSGGDVNFSYRLLCDCNWLDFSRKEGSVSASLMNRSCIDVTCRRENLIGKQTAEIVVQLNFDNGEQKEAKLYILADSREMIPNVFYERNGCICINAEHFIKKSDIMGRGFTRISDLGRSSSAMKCYPTTYDWSNQQCKPWMQYDVWLQHDGEYKIEFWLVARNPVIPRGKMKFSCSVNNQKETMITTLPENYYTDASCKKWSDGVLNQIHSVTTDVLLNQGNNRLFVYAGEPGIIMERILIYPKEKQIPYSYLGPEETR